MRERVIRAHQRSIDDALQTSHFDIVHMHGVDFHRYRLPRSMPVLVSLHLPPAWYPERIWNIAANVHLQCVSMAQRRECPPEHRACLPVIENGVPFPSERYERADVPFALMLSRICPEKNLHVGIDAARKSGISVVLAGDTFPYEDHLRYFRAEIAPRLSQQVQLRGPVGGREQQQLLGSARSVLIPTLAPETSSLVAMEALHAGTPVVAFPSGAIPEIIEHHRTGFLVRSTEEMAEAITHADQIDREVCRQVARDRIYESSMVDEYLALYASILASAPR